MPRDNKLGPAPGIIGRRCEKTAAILRIRSSLEAKGYRIFDVSPDGVEARRGLGRPIWVPRVGSGSDA